MMLDRDVTTGHCEEVILIYGLSNSLAATAMTECPWRLFPYCKPFSSAIFRIFGTSRGPSASAELLVKLWCLVSISVAMWL